MGQHFYYKTLIVIKRKTSISIYGIDMLLPNRTRAALKYLASRIWPAGCRFFTPCFKYFKQLKSIIISFYKILESKNVSAKNAFIRSRITVFQRYKDQ